MQIYEGFKKDADSFAGLKYNFEYSKLKYEISHKGEEIHWKSFKGCYYGIGSQKERYWHDAFTYELYHFDYVVLG